MTRWRVRPDGEAEFLDAVRELAEVLMRLPGRPGELTLVRSADDPTVFHSIGWFHSQGELEAMRQDPDARRLLDHLVAICAECRPTAHHVVHTTAGPPAGAPA
ncbi:antibiotic biosynthesis monooxygenase family protein [Pseudonocardia lacus]|uniref:antibiotic biosynthesis monooxygenase family protein n=1 Tax=Pseudonocardia lacus TaxID=2835865 RepID=UPI001BDC73B3|nr:antibiotic biosynthesis monooxygenase [Pseudonocardia lacus]